MRTQTLEAPTHSDQENAQSDCGILSAPMDGSLDQELEIQAQPVPRAPQDATLNGRVISSHAAHRQNQFLELLVNAAFVEVLLFVDSVATPHFMIQMDSV